MSDTPSSEKAFGEKTSGEKIFQVAVDAPLMFSLSYKTQDHWQRGESVIVPLGKRRASAVVLGEGPPPKQMNLRDIEARDESRPLLPGAFLKWLEWLADYYVHPIGQVAALAFPPLSKKDSTRKSKKPPVVRAHEASAPLKLMSEQATAVKAIKQHERFSVHLLHGVTGSGKTEVYLQLLQDTLAQGKSGLVLVPEIALTPQLINRFAARFGDNIAVIHSHLTERERTNQWWAAVSGEKKILIGARSALFCPLPHLGLIVVDEEHESSYKQEEKLRYHARDAAVMLAKFLDIPIVLGSATPSLESWQNVQTGKYFVHTMASRVADRQLPEITVLDLRESKENKKNNPNNTLPYWLSPQLHAELTRTLERGEQAALFLNRRGVAPTVMCTDCGFVYKCPNCEISLTLHGKRDLVCHYCDYHLALGEYCSSCKVAEPKALGLGTEQVENDIQKIFPSARVARADRDEIHSRESLENLIDRMESGDIDVLVGTQMIAKGLDFPKLTLVGLVLADVGFNLPDFRATERSFQLLTQMAGRAGRHVADGGRVIIQTYNPEFPGLEFAKRADYLGLTQFELALRKELLYPPFGKLAALKISGADLHRVSSAAEHCARRAGELKNRLAAYNKIQILGPTEAPLAKLRGKYRFHILLRTPTPNVLSAFCRQLLDDESWIPAATKVQVDIDPLNLL